MQERDIFDDDNGDNDMKSEHTLVGPAMEVVPPGEVARTGSVPSKEQGSWRTLQR
jgi:hypothetical protein